MGDRRNRLRHWLRFAFEPVRFYEKCPVCGRMVEITANRGSAPGAGTYWIQPTTAELVGGCHRQNATTHGNRPPAPETGATRRERISAVHQWAEERLQHPES